MYLIVHIFSFLGKSHCSVDVGFYFEVGRPCADDSLSVIKFLKSLLEVFVVDKDDAFSDELIVDDVFVFGSELLSGEIVLDGFLVLAEHEVSEGSIEVEELVEILSQLVVLLEFVEVVHSFFDLPFHQKNNSFSKEFVFVDVY